MAISLLLVCSIVSFSLFCIIQTTQASDEEILWSLTVHVEAEGNLKDHVVVGEALNASNGKDLLDMPKPPSPQPPYIRIWLATSLDIPYNALWEEYRSYPSDQNIYNLTIFVSSQNNTSTNVTVSWDATDIDSSGYSSIGLYENDEFLIDMKTTDMYLYETAPNSVHMFTIRCTKDANDDGSPPVTNGGSYLPTILFILVIIVIIIGFVLWSRKK